MLRPSGLVSENSVPQMLLYALLVHLLPLALSSGPEVRLPTGGKLRGVYQTTLGGRKIAAYLGVPYAKPPQRFKEAERAEPWKGVLQAVDFKPDCLQFTEVTMDVVGSEDCLYANVFTPQITDGEKKLYDVVIYIHGGGFSFKIGDFGAKYILDRDVVYVAFSYRLGPLGFLSTGDRVLPGNLGLKDQNRLLRWVKENIGSFGGNPDNVLLTGTSAGGASVHYHMLSPLSRDLIHRAYSMSGSALCCWTQTENSREKAEFIAKKLGCPTGSSEEIVHCLSQKDGKAVVKQLHNLQKWGYYPFTPLGPVVEPDSPTAFITKYPSEIIRDGEAMDIPWLTTFTSEEGLYPAAAFIANESVLVDLDNNWNELLPSLLDYEHTTTIFPVNKVSQKIREKYIGNSSVLDSVPGIIKMCSDRLFIDCIVRAAELHADFYKAPVYTYIFSYRGTHSGSEFFTKTSKNYGVCHGDDTAYIFDNRVLSVEDSEMDRKMIDVFTEMVVNFAATGKPSMKGMRNWPEVTAYDDFTYVNIKDPDTFEIVSSPKTGQIDFWGSLKLAED